MDVKEAAARSGLGRNSILLAIKSGDLRAHYSRGARRKKKLVIYRDDLQSFIDNLPIQGAVDGKTHNEG